LHPLPKLSGLGLERKTSPVCNSNWWQTDPSGGDPYQSDSLKNYLTAQQLAEFFLYLFEDKGYTPSTIKGYRSAIAKTIHLSGGSDFGSDEFLSLMFKNFCFERPKQRCLVPTWDLGIVLKALQLSPFEPLDLIIPSPMTLRRDIVTLPSVLP
jgi:hypothetical protein